MPQDLSAPAFATHSIEFPRFRRLPRVRWPAPAPRPVCFDRPIFRRPPADLQLLDALKIATVVDLRRPAEREKYPTPPLRARVVDHPGIADGELPPHLSAFDEAGTSATAARAAMIAIYRSLPFDPMIVELYRNYFAVLEEGEGPVLVHCAAGKDRTGVICALTHHLAGVGRDDTLADYLATNDSDLVDADAIARICETMTREGRPATEAAARMVLSVREDFLEAAFAAIAERYTSLDAYLEDVLALTPRRRRSIVACLTEPA